MKKLLFFFITISSLYCSELQKDDTEKYISSFKQTLLKKGNKLLEKTKNFKTSKNSQELIVDLRNPTYKNGILLTHEGGVIKGHDIRIQAKTIQYIKRIENGALVHRIEAEGDLIIQYKGKVYVGEELEYDFITKTGTVYEGKTFASFWYLGGDKIELKSDGSYHVDNVFVTTCENIDSTWDIHAGKVNVLKKDLLQAKNVRFRFFKLPTLWLPSFKINLKKFLGTPIIKYNVNWDKKSGPRGTVRYRLYSWRDFGLWGRLDYRLKMGWGGAIETEYHPTHGRTIFDTKNYLASDVIEKELVKKRRYRVQGVYSSVSPTGKTKANLTWDKFSDINMPSDFKSDDFELNTAKKSEFTLRREEKSYLGILYARPRLNSFDTVKQQLPTGYVTIKPYKSPNLGVMFYNSFSTSYLNYQFSDKLSPSINSFESARLETHNIVSRPLKTQFLTLTPYVGFIGIFYNKSPESTDKKQAMFLYGGALKTHFFKNYKRHKHILEPYISYKGITEPTEKVDSYYIFSIDDGYNKLNLIKTGIKNQVYSLKKIRSYPSFEADLYANTFLDSHFIPRTLPKLYLDLNWNLPSVFLSANSAWNFYAKTLDFSNIRLGWSVNEAFAFSVEFRYRSSYDFRKANHENFILDVSRDVNLLKDTSISDKRNTFLTHAYFRLNPFWSCEIESHHGWNRKKEPPYNEYKVSLFTFLSSAWKVRVTYQHTTTDDKFSGAVSLIK
ncbi:MAG: hypothetical protein JXA94_03730 [Parachlamydiales bacterium]|nr:hypothetical protein [Parachlamydiales bacterium]